MSENTTTQPEFSLQRIYTKDVSFETPHSPEIFIEEWNPEMNFNLNTQVKEIDEENYEVVLHITVTVKNKEKTAFLVEVQQAGIFRLIDIPKEQLGPLLGVNCPNILFPYARELVSDLVGRGSFPQLLLAPVNFDQLYVNHLKQMQQAAQEAPGEQKH